MKRVIIGVAGLIISSLCIWSSILICEDYEEPQEVIFIGVPIYEKKEEKMVVIEETIIEVESEEIIFVEEVDEPILPFEDVELIALITMAEAEGESELGKRLVIDTILNRVDHEKFPNSVREVIYFPNAFSCISNGRIDRCYVTDDICNLVLEELEERTDSEVLYFRGSKYSKYGTPAMKVGNHYFSK